MLTLNDLPTRPPSDDLQRLLRPLQALSDRDLTNLPDEDHEGVLPNLELLTFRADGTPEWWPLNRGTNGRDWTSDQRRRVLLERIMENLPVGFPPTPSQPSDVLSLVSTLRHIAYAVNSEDSGILASS